MIVEIHAEIIDAFQGGSVQVMCTSKAGHAEAIAKDGSTQKVPYAAGDVLLVKDGRLVCGPVGWQGGVAFAERVLEGDHRALTDPAGIQMLATVIISLSSLPQFQLPEVPAQQEGISA